MDNAASKILFEHYKAFTPRYSSRNIYWCPLGEDDGSNSHRSLLPKGRNMIRGFWSLHSLNCHILVVLGSSFSTGNFVIQNKEGEIHQALLVTLASILFSYPQRGPIPLTGGVVLLLISVIWTGAQWNIKHTSDETTWHPLRTSSHRWWSPSILPNRSRLYI